MALDKERIEAAARAICTAAGNDPDGNVMYGRYNPDVARRFGFPDYDLRDRRTWMDFIEEASNHVAAFDALRDFDQKR